VHAVDVRARGGRTRALVLRRFVRADWLAREPDSPVREAQALDLVAGIAAPTPALVAVDSDGSEAGIPAVLMTRLDGGPSWRPDDVEGYLRGLARLLAAVHAGPLPPPGSAIAAYRPYGLRASGPPASTRRPAMWERAFAVFAGPPPSTERRLLHRDFHPGNVLWTRAGAIGGLVDWVNASVGPPAADAGHCRMNLARAFGQEAADRFLALTGMRDYHPYWDVVAALGGFDDADLAAWSPRDEDFLAAAVARLGGCA
jgi:aminoglycoside phosphotransferase (APT) family kinase protein